MFQGALEQQAESHPATEKLYLRVKLLINSCSTSSFSGVNIEMNVIVFLIAHESFYKTT